MKTKDILMAVGVVLGLVGGVWALDKHWLTVDKHESCQVEVAGMFEQMQRSMYVRDLQNAVFFWQREVNTLQNLIRQYPQDQRLRTDLNYAIGELNRARQALDAAMRPGG